MLSPRCAFKSNRDGRHAEAVKFIDANHSMSVRRQIHLFVEQVKLDHAAPQVSCSIIRAGRALRLRPEITFGLGSIFEVVDLKEPDISRSSFADCSCAPGGQF